MRPSEAEFKTALLQFEERERLFRAERLAEPDPGLQAYRILAWVAERCGVKVGEVQVKRYPDHVARGVNGFHWKGSRTIYLAKSAGGRTALHEALHVCRPDLCEAVVLRLAGHYAQLLTEPVGPAVVSPPPERVVEWDLETR